MKQVEKLALLLIQAQGTYGTAETDVGAADVIETIGPATMTLNPNSQEVDLVAGAFSQDPSVPGAYDLDLAFKVYVRSAGSDTPGQYGNLLELAGLLKAEAVDGTYTYTPTSKLSEMKDFTVFMYSGNLDTAGAILRKAQNGIIIPKWTFAAGKPTVMDCSAKMAYVAIPAAGTSPAITKLNTIPTAMLGATIKINNVATFQLIGAEIDFGQTADLTLDPSKTYGRGVNMITDRKIKWTAKCYQDLPASGDPETALNGMTNAAWEITYGTQPQKYSWTSTYGQITDVKHDDEGGISTWSLSGIMARNDFTHTLTTK